MFLHTFVCCFTPSVHNNEVMTDVLSQVKYYGLYTGMHPHVSLTQQICLKYGDPFHTFSEVNLFFILHIVFFFIPSVVLTS